MDPSVNSPSEVEGPTNPVTRKVPMKPQKNKLKSAIAGASGKIKKDGKFLKTNEVAKKFEGIITEAQFYERINNPNDDLHVLKEFVPAYYGTEVIDGVEYLVLEDVSLPYQKNMGVMDVKIGLSSRMDKDISWLPQYSVARLLGFFVHGVEIHGLVQHNRVNNFRGYELTVDVQHKLFKRFFRAMGKNMKLFEKVERLIEALSKLNPNYRFNSSSLLFLFDESKEPTSPEPNFFFIDFAQFHVAQPDVEESQFAIDIKNNYQSHCAVNSLKFVLYEMRLAWDKHPLTIYLIRHGERWDYTDIEWAKQSEYPHDSPLSKVGERQAADTAERLAYTKPHLVISSPFQRSVMHAEAVSKRTRVKIGIEPGVAEFMCKETRTKVPDFFLSVTSVTPWVSTKYEPFKPYLSLETWPELIARTQDTLDHLIQQCEGGKGDLLIFSHRSTLQSLIAHLVPDYEGDTKLEYGAIAMFVEDPRVPGKWQVVSFNEVKHMETLKKSPSSNPFRHIEGYYEDLSWAKYKSTGKIEEHVSGPPTK